MEGRLCEHGKKQWEHRRDKRTSTASRESNGSTEVLIVITDFQISAKVLSSNLTARQDMVLEARVVFCGRESVAFQ